MSIIEAMGWGVGFVVIAVLLGGIRRLPWRFATLGGVGGGVVLATLRLATLDGGFDPGLLVLVGAIGGSLATLGMERGERERSRRSLAIVAGQASRAE